MGEPATNQNRYLSESQPISWHGDQGHRYHMDREGWLDAIGRLMRVENSFHYCQVNDAYLGYCISYRYPQRQIVYMDTYVGVGKSPNWIRMQDIS